MEKVDDTMSYIPVESFLTNSLVVSVHRSFRQCFDTNGIGKTESSIVQLKNVSRV